MVTADGTIVWYCTGRFDRPSLFASLLDTNAGSWLIDLQNSARAGRRYLEKSGILETGLAIGPDRCTVTDWMPVCLSTPAGAICRIFSEMPGDANVTLRPRPDYGRKHADIVSLGDAVSIDGAAHYVYASHSLSVDDETVLFGVPRGESGWAVLSDEKLAPPPTQADLERWLETSLAYWRKLAASVDYEGPYEREIAASLRAIQLLFIRARKKAGGKGKIINITSVHQEIPPAGAAGYDFSKGGLRNLTRTLALELAPDRINVNNIAPGMVLTPMNQEAIDDPKVLEEQVQSIPFKRAAEPKEIARLAVYLASDDADYATGQTFTLDGGLSMNLGQGA